MALCSLTSASFLQELHSGSPSRSSSSLSFQSTPPPQPSPAPFGQPLMNGLGRGGLCDGLLGGGGGHSALALAGSPQLGLGGGGGALGGLNGVIQSPAHNAPPQPALPALRPQPPPLNVQALAQGLQLPKSLSPYVPPPSVAYPSALRVNGQSTDCIYTALVLTSGQSKHITIIAVHLPIHSHTDGGFGHVWRQPARRDRLGGGVSLSDTLAQSRGSN